MAAAEDDRKTAVSRIVQTGLFRVAAESRPRTFLHRVAYLVSWPERGIRSLTAFLGGVVLGLSRLLPRPIRKSRFFRVAVLKLLQVVIEGIGRAEVFEKEAAGPGGDYMPRKVLGSVIDNASLAFFHLSPIWILLVLSDVLHGSRIYLAEVTAELKKAGVIHPDSTVDNVDTLIASISRFSGDVAESLDTPPMSVDQMKNTLVEIRKKSSSIDLKSIFPEAEIQRLSNEIKEAAHLENKSIFEVSAGLATYVVGRAAKGAYGTGLGILKGVEVGARLAWTEVVQDYLEGLSKIRRSGLDVLIAEGLAPYLKATAHNFDPQVLTFTELGLSFGRWKNVSWRLRAN